MWQATFYSHHYTFPAMMDFPLEILIKTSFSFLELLLVRYFVSEMRRVTNATPSVILVCDFLPLKSSCLVWAITVCWLRKYEFKCVPRLENIKKTIPNIYPVFWKHWREFNSKVFVSSIFLQMCVSYCLSYLFSILFNSLLILGKFCMSRNLFYFSRTTKVI